MLAVATQGGAVARAAALDPPMVVVPAGPFVRGDDAGESDERPQRRIDLPAFAIDRTEVTREAYSDCVAKGACRPPAVPPGTFAPAAQAAGVPVVYVSWQDAAAYCAWVGKRLPSEAEWEKTARSTDGRRYPWGNEFSCARGNFGNFAGDGRCADEGAKGHPVPVGSFPSGASPYGALDLAGNVWEWVADAYAADAYQHPPARPPAVPDQARKKPSERRVLRGGGCCSIFGLPRSADRLALPPTYRDNDIGFRCAKDLAAPPRPAPPTPPIGP
jgi:formylglycine-generating enzyme required for sulfatase activity